MSETNPEPNLTARDWEIAMIRLGGALRTEALPGILGIVDDLAMHVLCLDQLCDECASGTHPQLAPGLYGIVNTLSWLLGIAKDGTHIGGSKDGMFRDSRDARSDAIAAMPAFARLLEQAVSTDEERRLIDLHPELGDLLKSMALWLNDPEGAKESLG